MMVRLRSPQAGFTFVELLVVITIIGVLFASAVVAFSQINVRSRDAKRGSDLQVIRQALEMCRSISGVYPATIYPDGVKCADNSITLAKTPSDPKPDLCSYIYTPSEDKLSYELTACSEVNDIDPVGQKVTSP